jgi:hypothetical protein
LFSFGFLLLASTKDFVFFPFYIKCLFFKLAKRLKLQVEKHAFQGRKEGRLEWGVPEISASPA